MTPSTIQNLYSEFRATYVNDADFVIDFYEKNALFFNNIKELNDKEELRMYIEVVEKYIWAFYNKGSYNIAIDLVDKHQAFIDKEIQRLNADELKNEWYYGLPFVKGMASYNLNDYKTATRIFKRLVLIDNKNDKYKNWLNSSQYGQRILFMTVIQVGSILLIAIPLFLIKYIPYKIGGPSSDIGILGILFVVIYEYYMRRSRRQKGKTVN